MKNPKILLVLGLLIFVSTGAQSDCDKPKNSTKKQTNKMDNSNKTMPDEAVSTPEKSDLKMLAEGSNGKMEKPFIFVARIKESYAQLQTMTENLPSASEIDFNKSAVVAAFAGTKNTGGFSVAFDKIGDEISVKVISPPEGAMVTEALTMPYKVALVPVEEEASLTINLSENWKTAAQTYKVSSGEFSVSGGFTGRETKFEAQGTIEVLTSGDFVTLIFNLTGKGSDKKLNEIASGNLKSGKVDLTRLEAGNFLDRPHPPLIVSGTISAEKLSLTFEPGKRDYVVNDGFEGRGKLEAEKIR
jgi:hypothetical protein